MNRKSIIISGPQSSGKSLITDAFIQLMNCEAIHCIDSDYRAQHPISIGEKEVVVIEECQNYESITRYEEQWDQACRGRFVFHTQTPLSPYKIDHSKYILIELPHRH